MFQLVVVSWGWPVVTLWGQGDVNGLALDRHCSTPAQPVAGTSRCRDAGMISHR